MSINYTYFTVTKVSGEHELFFLDKYKQSLKPTGLSDTNITSIVETVLTHVYDGISTKKLYWLTFQEIKKRNITHASRYSLKQALFLLGPTGFPFERIVAALLEHLGYTVKVDQMVAGKCIYHETDIIAVKNNTTTLVEVKFHNTPDMRSPVQTSLYVKARFDDIKAVSKENIDHSLLVTNTEFSLDALQYGNCVGIEFLSWDYPHNQGLEVLLEQYNLYPITTLINLSPADKKLLLEDNIVLCTELLEQKERLLSYGLSQQLVDLVYEECSKLCG